MSLISTSNLFVVTGRHWYLSSAGDIDVVALGSGVVAWDRFTKTARTISSWTMDQDRMEKHGIAFVHLQEDSTARDITSAWID